MVPAPAPLPKSFDPPPLAVTENLDAETVRGFGDEWRRFDQSALSAAEIEELFARYFAIFPWDRLPADASGADFGCGSGRWARLAASRVGHLHCVDASAEALEVCRRTLAAHENCTIMQASVGALPLPENSLDFAYSLGVLHHVPDTAGALRHCVSKLKPGAPFLVYLYYALDNRPLWYRWLWRGSNLLRRIISKLPHPVRFAVSQIIAAAVYFPVARIARWAERAGAGAGVDRIPLSAYRNSTFYTMRTDALDRFGTRLEQRFTRAQIQRMMAAAGLRDIRFSEDVPFWCAVGFREVAGTPT